MKVKETEKVKKENNENFVNWNKYSLHNLVKFLEEKFQFDPSWEAKCISILCEWYRYNNFPAGDRSNIPTDLEIEQEHSWREKANKDSGICPVTFIDGAKWMKRKMLENNNRNN